MNYIYTDSIDWADEFDVEFGEIISELDYQKFQYAKEKLHTLVIEFYFGTNEGWDDFDIFEHVEYTPIPDEDVDILQKYGCPQGEDIIGRFYGAIEELLEEDNPFKERSWYSKHYGYYFPHLDETSLEEFKEVIDYIATNKSK